MLKVEKLCKSYPTFCLKDVTFELPTGYIMGFIGMNGAGKSTTLKSILNISKPDSGNVIILGKNMKEHEIALKKSVGFMLGPIDNYTRSSAKTIKDIYSSFFDTWEEQTYKNYLKKFNLDENKKIYSLSAGMKVKFNLALALSHGAKLIILDEPTSGLDPIARDELLDLFQELVENGDKSILFSTHITSDLDKCADFIIFIKDGKIIANSTKDDLINNHIIIKGSKRELSPQLKANVISYKQNAYGFSALIEKSNLPKNAKFETEKPNLEDIMVYYNKEKE